MKKNVLLFLCASFQLGLAQQDLSYTKDEYLRGSITPEREWWDLNYYHLDIEVDLETRFISGTNTIRYKVLLERDVMQIDLQPPMKIDKITQNGKELAFKKKGANAYGVLFSTSQVHGSFNEIVVHYSGHPKEAIRAPWDGGFSWKEDSNGYPFIATSCQGLGASVWWPNKDHMYDEVDSMAISVTVPKDLMDVSNGRLRKVEENGDKKNLPLVCK